MIMRLLLTIIVFAVSTLLFKSAAGSLKLTKLNMISTIYYFILVFNLVGASLIFLGLRSHYLVRKVDSLQTIDQAYYALAYCVIVFPATLILVKKGFSRIFPQSKLSVFLKEGIQYHRDMSPVQGVVLMLVFICTAATIYVFMNLGYIPVVELIRGSNNIDGLRQLGNRYFQGNQYIKNLLMVALVPFVSYFTYIYARITKSLGWRLLFAYMAVLSVIVLTYDFSKSPIINYFLGLYLIEVASGKVKNNKQFGLFLAVSVIVVLFLYVVVFKVGDALFSIYTGPVGRIIFTQIATLFLHFDAFPARHPFLCGASFNGWMSLLIPNAEGLRSGRVVMSIYNAQGVADKTAGVMNTVFIGEAYANFGIMGVIIAPVVFGIAIGIAAYLLQGLKKRPTSILLYVQLTLLFVTIVEGGFVDIFYNAASIFFMIIAIALYLVTNEKYNRQIETYNSSWAEQG